MRDDPPVLVGWALLVGLLAGVAFAWAEELPGALIATAAALGGVLAIYLLVRRPSDAPESEAETRALPDLSVATVIVAVGLSTALVGVYVGYGLSLIGAGLIVLGIGGLVREGSAARRRRP